MDEEGDVPPRSKQRPRGLSFSSFVMDRYFQGDKLAFEPPPEMKQAFYNAAAIFFILLLCVLGLFVTEIFKAFIRPLLWAVLCGTFLFPFKKTTNEFMRDKLSHCQSVGLPISLYLFLLPFWLLIDAGDLIVRIFQRNWILFLLTGVCMTLLGWFSLATLSLATNLLSFILDTSQYLLETADAYQAILIWFVIVYFITSIFLPFLYKSEVLASSLSALLLPVWMLVATLALLYIQVLQLPLFLLIQSLLVSASLLIQFEKRRGAADPDASLSAYKSDLSTVSIGETIERVLSPVHPVSDRRHVEPEPELSRSGTNYESVPGDLSYVSASTTHSSPDDKPASKDTQPTDSSTELKPKGWLQIDKLIQEQRDTHPPAQALHFSHHNIRRDLEKLRSAENRASRDRLFFLLFWACFLYKLFNNYWLLSLLLLPLPWIGLKWFLSTAVSRRLIGNITALSAGVPRLCPDALVHAYYFFLKLDDKLLSWLESSLDKLVTIFIMCMVCVVTCLFAAFSIMQFRQESFQIMLMGSHAWNRTAEYSISTLNQIMNSTVYENQNVSSLINDKLGDWSGQIYFSSRQWLASEIRELISDADEDINEEARVRMEEQLVDTLDQMFAAFRALQNSSGTFALATPLSSNASFSDIAMSIVSSRFNANSISNIVKLLKSNLSVIINLFRSLGELLVTNFGVLFFMSGKLFSLLLGGGKALINFFFASIIFFTSLFYLMLYSKSNYIPMRRILEFIPVTNVGGLNPAKEIERALSEAIVSVFDASLRMALFYGVYTWLIHSVFGVSIAFIPAAFAAVAGVVPFVGSYWACLAGVLELWLIRGQSLLAVTFFVLHLLPSYVVDQAIYVEVKGGAHPYLTGLAVAGGVYFNGIEGAIIGPIILCCLLAGTNMYRMFIGRKGGEEVEETIEM